MTDTLEELEKSLQKLCRDYQALNSSFATELHHTPTALEFSRFVSSNRPLVVRNHGANEPALTRWTTQYLIDSLVDKPVKIAVSPDGNADSIIGNLFVEPAEINLNLEDFFALLNNEDLSTPVYYLQSQNGNLSEDGELSSLYKDIGTGPAFAQEFFQELPDVANIWIGDKRSITSLHKDPYENLYLVIRGSKTFTLYPPSEFYALHGKSLPLQPVSQIPLTPPLFQEQLFSPAHYEFTPPSTFTIEPTPLPTTQSQQIPWIPVSPLSTDLSLYPRYAYARPMTITLEKGDMLFLPSLWFHHVQQDVGPCPSSVNLDEPGGEKEVEAAIAVNWWFDMDMGGAHWALSQFVRKATLLLDGRRDDSDDEESEDEL